MLKGSATQSGPFPKKVGNPPVWTPPRFSFSQISQDSFKGRFALPQNCVISLLALNFRQAHLCIPHKNKCERVLRYSRYRYRAIIKSIAAGPLRIIALRVTLSVVWLFGCHPLCRTGCSDIISWLWISSHHIRRGAHRERSFKDSCVRRCSLSVNALTN